MPSEWSEEIIAQMHMKGITGKKLVEITGYTEQYISYLLNGHRETVQARERIEAALKSA